MLRSKKEVERHVADVLSKIENINEKHLRGYTFARLFFQVKDYESAKKYLTGFLSIRDHHAASHKLMAQIYEATNNPENALQSYKRSLEIDPHQNDIVLKICELYCQLPVDHDTARYWADRAEQLYPHHDTVFKLREYLVSAEGEPDRQELENLIASDLAAQPKNVDRRIKLLRLYLDTERVKDAYDHATMIESKQLFPYSIDWYYLLGDIFEAYQEENGEELDSQFYINYLTALDHLIYLTLAEPHAFILENGKKSSSLNDAAAVLLTFDQLLKKAVQKDIREGSWTYFMNHMKGQLYFHMTSLLMKRAKMDQANRKEAFRFSAGLAIVCYTFKPINLLHEVWFSQLEDNQKVFTNFFQQGSLRTSFMGHVLLSLCKDDRSSWVQKMKTEVCIPQVKERIYSRIFSSLFNKEKLLSSYFISDATFEQSSLELPSEIALEEFDKSAYKLCPDSLHHLVWLELHRENARISSNDSISEIFKNLQYSNKNLSKGSCESLCVLDLEAYLHATVYQSKFIIERKNNILNAKNDSLLSYPPDISDALCTTAQATWWKATYGLYTSTVKEKLGEHRRTLQQGLEVIRGIGCHGMEVQLVIHLAHVFSSKADTLDKVSEIKMDKNKNKISLENVNALYSRAIHYWNIALGMLEKLASGKTLNVRKDPMFLHSNKPLSKNDIKAYQEEGQLFIAVRLMDSEKLNEAAELLEKLSSPYGSYYLALTLKKLASQEQKFTTARTSLLNRAKISLHDTMDRIKEDRTHPLNSEIYLQLEDIENELALEQSIVRDNVCEDSDEVDSYDETSMRNLSYSAHEHDNATVHSTPRPSKFITSRHSVKSAAQTSPKKHFEPSPERLDAQIRALALNQDTVIKSFLQQQQALLDTNKSMVEAVKQSNDVLGQIKKQLDELSLAVNQKEKYQAKTVPKQLKPIYIKGQGDEVEDYYDPNVILDYYEDAGEDFRASGYSFDRASRIGHDPTAGASAPLNYVVPPTLPPPGPPSAVNHYNYQYPPHGLVPTPPPAVPGRPYYHAPPGQGLPFNEGQQLPQFHFHVASSVGKPPPPPPLSTSLPQVVPGLPPPPVSVPPMPVVLPPPAVAPNSWSKPVSVPHAFQIPLPPSTVAPGVSSVPPPPPPVVQATSSSTLPAVTTSYSQLKDLLQTPPVTRTITFGLPATSATSTTLSTSPSIFAGLHKTPETPKEPVRYDCENTTSPDIDGHDLEREVMGDFKPLIPLPAEIVVETGEENEIVLFEDRAKLYRFVDQEWKERGIGVIKILHHESSGRVRLLMRRDQVLKVCANHYITSNMEIHPMKNSDKAWTWVAQDFADEELRPEHFCIRFKTPEIAAMFKNAFEKAVNISKELDVRNVASPKATTVTTSPLSTKSFGTKFLPKPGSWTCPTCYVSNHADKLLCVACETKKPGSQTTIAATVAGPAEPFGTKFLPKPGSWNCPTCYVSNSEDKLHCVACETKKVGSQMTVASTIASPSETFGVKFLPKPGSWTCPTCYVSNPGDKLLCAACETKKPGSQPSVPSTVASPSETFGAKFLPKPGSWTCPTCYVSNPGDKLLCPACETKKPGSQPSVPSTVSSSSLTTDFGGKPFQTLGGFTFSSNPVIQEAETSEASDREILLVSTKAKNGPQVTKVEASSPFSGFSFKITSAQSSMQNIKPAFTFSKISDKEASSDEIQHSVSNAQTPSSVFHSKSTLSDSSKSGDFVFGIKPATQPTTFTFGLSGLPNKSNEPIGFKPTFPTSSNAPAVFGGATQKASEKSSAVPQSTNIFGGTPAKSESSSSQISSIFGGAKKTDSSKNASIFGGVKDSKTTFSSFGEPATSLFGINNILSGGALEKSETTSFGVIEKSQASSTSPIPTGTTNSQSVFNFGTSPESSETGPVEFRFGSPQKYEFNFSGVRPRSPTKTPKSPATPSDVEEEEENESFDADNIYFQPVIPLPPKIDIKTGEENQKTLFCKRAKLFRFSSGEWKERGIGDFKILYDEGSKKSRFLMRRDQVLKVCLNHYLTEDITFERKGDKTLSWAATDFSESEPAPELYALRFKTSEFADECLAAIEAALKPMEKPSAQIDVSKAAASFSFKTDTAPKSESLFASGSLSSRFGTSTAPSVCNSQTLTETSSSNDTSFTHKVTSSSFFEADSNSSSFADNKGLFFTKANSEASKTNQIFDNEVQVVHEVMPSPEEVALAKKYQLPETFYLYKNKPDCPGCIGCEDYVAAPKSTSNETTVTNTTTDTTSSQKIEQESKDLMFSTNAPSFADLASNTVSSFSSSNQKKGFVGAGTPLFANLNTSADGDKDEDTVAEGPDIHFEPVIPLPELIAVKTGEEDETPIFVNRAKLFRFDAIKKEWKERGVGDLKILQHNEKVRFRIILRRDQVHKIACNHCIAENMELSPLTTSETALCWNAVDYSDGEPEASQFAVRFKTKDMLAQFKQKFNECREILKKESEVSNVQNSVQLCEGTNASNLESSSKDNPAEIQNEQGSESETNEEDEDSEEDPVDFEKRVSFEICDAVEEDFQPYGMGSLRVLYDDSVYGYRICMFSDNGNCLCDHIIAIQTVLRTEKKKATWTAIDLSVDPPRHRRFRATFSSMESLNEFNAIFEDAKDAALQSEIVEKSEYQGFLPPGNQT